MRIESGIRVCQPLGASGARWNGLLGSSCQSYQKHEKTFFAVDSKETLRGRGIDLKKSKASKGFRAAFLLRRVINTWNKLLKEIFSSRRTEFKKASAETQFPTSRHILRLPTTYRNPPLLLYLERPSHSRLSHSEI